MTGTITPERLLRAHRVDREGRVEWVTAGISPPMFGTRTGGRGWFCRLHCPAVLPKDVDVPGFDANDARAAVMPFLIEMLDHHGYRIVDPDC